MTETRDEKWLTSWTSPPRRTTVVDNATEGHVWISGHDASRNQVDVQGLCCHQTLPSCLCVPHPKAMLIYVAFMSLGAILLCMDSWLPEVMVMSGSDLLMRDMPESNVLGQSGSVLVSMVPATTKSWEDVPSLY